MDFFVDFVLKAWQSLGVFMLLMTWGRTGGGLMRVVPR